MPRSCDLISIDARGDVAYTLQWMWDNLKQPCVWMADCSPKLPLREEESIETVIDTCDNPQRERLEARCRWRVVASTVTSISGVFLVFNG